MAINWYPIIGRACTNCLECVKKCPKGLLFQEKTQILLKESEKCPEGCKDCSLVCPKKTIKYYDGSIESLQNAFTGQCECHGH